MAKLFIAGIPRSGTTLLWRALHDLPPGDAIPNDIMQESDIKKVHAYNPNLFEENDRAVFLFGDVVLSVVSTALHRMDESHFRNCGCELPPSEVDLYEKDYLNYEQIFDLWTSGRDVLTLCLRYEALFENKSIIERFLGREVALPSHRERSTTYENIEAEDLKKIQRTYQGLIDKIRRFPDAALVAPEKSKQFKNV